MMFALIFYPVLLFPAATSITFLREVMERYIKDSLVAGIICLSSSPLEAGFFFIRKKDGTHRPCIDYHEPDITVKNKYPLPALSF